MRYKAALEGGSDTLGFSLANLASHANANWLALFTSSARLGSGS